MTEQKIVKNRKPLVIDSPAFEEAIAHIALNADERRAGGDEEAPFESLKFVRESGLSIIQLPKLYGGVDAHIKEVIYVVTRLAEADPDVAHILRAHYGHIELLKRANTEPTEQFEQIAQGIIFGNAFTELSKNNVGTNIFETTLLPEGDVFHLNGTKYFSTGTLYADVVVVVAADKDGKPISASIPTSRKGVTIEDDWDGFGQRFTASGTTKFENVIVYPNEVTPVRNAKVPFNSFAQLYIHAVIVGILKRVVVDASTLVKSRKRTFSFAAAHKPNEDPQLLQVIGEIESLAFAAEAVLLKVAEVVDKASKEAIDGVVQYELSHEASLQASKAKVIIDQLALRAATLLFEVGGSSATRSSAQLDRHWRNIRTLASHNPTIYKARVIGDYVVNGTELPLKEIYF